ncbi:hypothetical protein DPMN_157439 [Dreissena polymorpha]|uniref:Uncharacterized protein n=1 Tax=Dreissena polymorpha TaxID=45954 RepID=A0A9D4EHB5_DREPO|nr:hypothetical protein DPMN_157439 [Dreissena polymorpha]
MTPMSTYPEYRPVDKRLGNIVEPFSFNLLLRSAVGNHPFADRTRVPPTLAEVEGWQSLATAVAACSPSPAGEIPESDSASDSLE